MTTTQPKSKADELREVRDYAKRLPCESATDRWLRSALCELITVLLGDGERHPDTDLSGHWMAPPELPVALDASSRRVMQPLATLPQPAMRLQAPAAAPAARGGGGGGMSIQEAARRAQERREQAAAAGGGGAPAAPAVAPAAPAAPPAAAAPAPAAAAPAAPANGTRRGPMTIEEAVRLAEERRLAAAAAAPPADLPVSIAPTNDPAELAALAAPAAAPALVPTVLAAAAAPDQPLALPPPEPAPDPTVPDPAGADFLARLTAQVNQEP